LWRGKNEKTNLKPIGIDLLVHIYIDYNRLAMEEEAREEEAMEIDWVTVTVDDEEEDGLVGGNAVVGRNHGMQMHVQSSDDYRGSGGYNAGGGSSIHSEAPF
jgi:hypothetical protein